MQHPFLKFSAALALGISTLAAAEMPSPLEIVLAPEGGSTPLDRQILQTQEQIKAAPTHQQGPLVEKLGWIFVAKARLSNDPGYYKLAEQCAALLRAKSPDDLSGLLLRGHILDAMHRFREAEAVGRELARTSPHSWESFALLGDALMEQGQLDPAVEAYQTMIDLRPCSQAYLRVAHLRWLKGDLDGALEVARLSVEAGSTRDPEPAAWAYTRLALYQWQNHDQKSAEWSLHRAQEFVPQYAPALLLQGKILLFQHRNLEAVELLTAAEQENPLPEYKWALADAQRAAGKMKEAAETEELLVRRGVVDDPRTFSLFLATRANGNPKGAADQALALAQAELQNRRDVFTQDAVAWAALSAGKMPEAETAMQAALADGTQDARLFLHAGAIASAAGQPGDAMKYFQKASALQQMLLPSEREILAQRLAGVSRTQSIKSQTAANLTAPLGHL